MPLSLHVGEQEFSNNRAEQTHITAEKNDILNMANKKKRRRLPRDGNLNFLRHV